MIYLFILILFILIVLIVYYLYLQSEQMEQQQAVINYLAEDNIIINKKLKEMKNTLEVKENE